jgi:tyrosine-specific transport protein
MINAIRRSVGFFQSVLSQKKGSLIGSILLICGSSIGVGILPLPILTGQAGTLPTLVMFVFCWLFMSTTALLILESSLLFSEKKNFISLSQKTLNRAGQIAVFFSFMFLFYSLTTAYLAKGGELVYHLCQDHVPFALPDWSGALFLAVSSGALIFLGPFIVDHINRIFMAGFFATYFFLTFVGNQYFNVSNVTHYDWSFSLFIIPFVVTSFGYHNMVPSINEYLGNDKRKLFLAILISGVILLFIYNFWVVTMHGIIPLKGEISIQSSFSKSEIVTESLAKLIKSPSIQISALYMAFFAIFTSLLGQGLSIIDFLADTLKIEKTAKVRFGLCLALFVPTLIFSQLIPGVFFKALELAGGIATMVIFGIIPALMSWVIRYRMKGHENSQQILVPGGKPMLISIICLALSLIMYEIVKNLC